MQTVQERKYQILHTEKGDIQVKRAFQADVNSAIILETPDGKYIYRDMNPVPNSVLVQQGIVPALSLTPTDKFFERLYTTSGGASRAMYQKDLSKDDFMVVPVKDTDGTDKFAVRKKDSPEAIAFVERTVGSYKGGSVAIEEVMGGQNGGNAVSEV